MPFKHDVFLSYNRSDPKSHLVKDLEVEFVSRSFDAFFDTKDLVEGRSAPIGDVLNSALAQSRLIVITVGMRGLGPHQKNEVDEAIKLSEAAQAKGERWPEVVVVRLGQLRHEELDGLIPDALIQNLSYVYKPAPAQASYQQLIDKLRETPKAAPEPDADMDEAPQAATAANPAEAENPFTQKDRLGQEIIDHGLIAFLGTCWPDRHLNGVFDPDEFAKLLRDEFNIPPDIAPGAPLDSLTSYAQLTLDDPKKEVIKLRDRFAVRSPQSYTELVALIESSRDQKPTISRDRGRPFITITTAQNALLEQEFLAMGKSFLLIRVNRTDCDQVLFDVRSQAPLTIGNGTKLDLSTQARRFVLEESQKDPFAESWEDMDELRMVVDRPTDVVNERYNRYREEVFTGEGRDGDDLAWQKSEYARLVEEHSRKYAVKAPWIANGGLPLALIGWCISQEMPIIIKLCGCVNQDEDIKMRISRFSTIGSAESMFPTWLTPLIIRTPTVFAGFSPVDYGFQTMYWRELGKLLDNSEARYRRRVFFSPEVLDHNEIPASAALDSFMARKLGNRNLPMNELQFVSGIRASEAFKDLRFSIG